MLLDCYLLITLVNASAQQRCIPSHHRLPATTANIPVKPAKLHLPAQAAIPLSTDFYRVATVDANQDITMILR